MKFAKPDPVCVGGRIRALRRQRHLTQVELALKIGIRAGPLSMLEKDTISPRSPCFIDVGMNVERQLFRLAVELGRIYLYNGGMRKRDRIGKLDVRHAAKRFAALLLMPDEAVIASVRQTGVAPDQWTWAMLMRLKHRFGVSAESFLYRLEELDLITPTRRNEIKERIYAQYEKTGWKEPDSSRRILRPNGRLGDLLLSAEQRGSDELPALKEALKKAGVAKIDML